MTKRRMNGRTAFLQLLVDEGITHLFGNPGTTELPIMEALADFPQLRYVLGLQESIVLGMADGYSRASGRLSACNLHCTPGLGHAMGALYSAKFSGSPIIVTAGQYELGHGLTEPLLYAPLVPIAAPLVKWAVEVERIEDLPRIVHRAAKLALTPPTGPVFLSLPGSILDDEAELELGRPSRVRGAVRPADAQIDELARRVLAADHPAILAGREVADRDAFAAAGEFATLIGAPVWLDSVPYNARFPTSHPANRGEIGRGQEKVRQTLAPHDLLIGLGGDLLRMSAYSPVEPLPDGMPVVHVSERDWELGKNYDTEWAVCADVNATLVALNAAIRRLQTPAQARAAAARLAAVAADNWTTRRAKAAARFDAMRDARPIAPEHLMLRVADCLPRDAIVLEEALTSTTSLMQVLPVEDPRGFYGLSSGGLGFAMPGAVGVSLAHPGRPVVAVVGDGSSMYAIQALWTAAHLKLPITYVIANNRGYRIIKDRLISMRDSDHFIGMDFDDPPIDFVGLARSLGLAAHRVTEPADIDATLQSAFASGAPTLVDCAIANGYGG